MFELLLPLICPTLASGVLDLEQPEQRHLIEVARAAVVTAVDGRSSLTKHDPTPSKPVFVTIEVDGTIRGCRGDLRPRTRSLDDEVRLAATDAATRDPRYRPLSKKELAHFLVTVTVVDRTEPIDNVDNLAPDDGLILTSGNHIGVVLPWEGKDPKTRLTWAYRKAKVAQDAPVSLSRLVATRFRG